MFWLNRPNISTMGPDMTIEDLISDLLSDDVLQRQKVESVLKEYPVENVMSEMSRLLRSPDKQIRSRGMELFCCMGYGAVPALSVLITDDEWTVRYRAAEALGIIGGNAACAQLLSSLEDQKDHVRYMAAKGLGILSYYNASDAVSSLLKDENEFVRGSAARALGQMGCVESVPLIETALEHEEYEKTRMMMEGALACLNGQ